MALDNQLILTTVLVLGLGYFILTSKPHELSENNRKAIDAQNIDAQFDQIDEIFDEFKIDWSQRGNNAATTPITVEERDVLSGLEKNLQRINKEVGKLKPYDADDLHNFAKRRDRMYERIGRYKSKYKQAVVQATKDSRVISMDLGNIVSPGEHIGLFNSVAGPPTPAMVLAGVGFQPSRSRLPDSRSRSISERFGHRNAQSLSTHSAPDLKARLGGISKVRARRAARGKSVGQTPFDMAPLAGKRVNKNKPSDGMVLKHERGAFETTSDPSNNIAQQNARHRNQEADELNGDRAKETPSYVGPIDVTPDPVSTGFKNGEGLQDDAVDMDVPPLEKPTPVKAGKLRKISVRLSPGSDPVVVQMNSAPGKGQSADEKKVKDFTDMLRNLDSAWSSITKQSYLNDKYKRTLAILQGIPDLGGKMRIALDDTMRIHGARIQKSKKTRPISAVIIPSKEVLQQRPKRARTGFKGKRTPPPIPLPKQAGVRQTQPGPNMNAAPTLP